MSDRPNQPEGVDDAVGEMNASPPGELDSRLAEAEQQIAELREQLRDQQLRAMADLDNVRKRAEREISNGARFGAERVLGDLLAICDSLNSGSRRRRPPMPARSDRRGSGADAAPVHRRAGKARRRQPRSCR
jgi:Molecular chaperone GrpE (heat shock protein)